MMPGTGCRVPGAGENEEMKKCRNMSGKVKGWNV